MLVEHGVKSRQEEPRLAGWSDDHTAGWGWNAAPTSKAHILAYESLDPRSVNSRWQQSHCFALTMREEQGVRRESLTPIRHDVTVHDEFSLSWIKQTPEVPELYDA